MASNRAPGTEIEAYCSPCASVLKHVVVAAGASRISKVRCNACQHVHVYRKAQPKSEATATATRKSRAAERRKALATAGFDALMRGQDLEKAHPYDRASTFQVEDLLDHATFGAGIVVCRLPDGKIEVQFRDRRRVLIHECGVASPDTGLAVHA